MKKNIIFLFLFLNSFWFVRAQDDFQLPKSPSVSQINKYIDNPISYQSGLPQITVPIYKLDVNGYQLPISLSYHASGIKVDQRATEVGLGWSLNAGGVISRTVRGLPDEMKYDFSDRPLGTDQLKFGWLQSNRREIINDLDIEAEENKLKNNQLYMYNQFLPNFFYQEFNNAGYPPTLTLYSSEQTHDSEPDVFTFNFNGKSGSFIFDSQGLIRQYPLSDLKITYELGASIPNRPSYATINSFTVQDNDGTKYYFKTVGSVISQGENSSLTYGHSDSRIFMAQFNGLEGVRKQWENYVSRSYATYKYQHDHSSWHLTKIENVNGLVINFQYEQEELVYNPAVMQYLPPLIVRSNPEFQEFIKNENLRDNGAFTLTHSAHITQYSPRLTKISTENCIIEFKKGQKRKDEAASLYTIDGVEVYYVKNSSSKELVKKTSLNYLYAVSANSTESDTDGSRLILKSVREVDVENPTKFLEQSFSYKLYEFDGDNTHRLPLKKSFASDVWGHYNGKNDNMSFIPTIYVYPDIDTGERRFRTDKLLNYNGRIFTYPSSDRTIDPIHLDIGVLTKAKYSTGGYTEFIYESNDFLDEGESVKGGGLRIKSIKKNDGAKTLNYFYSYTDSLGRTTGRISSKHSFARVQGATTITNNHDKNFYDAKMYCFGNAEGEISSINGRHVGYKQVTETIEGNGKTVYRFSFPGALYENDDRSYLDNTGACDIASAGYCDNLYFKPKIYLLAVGGAHHLKPNMEYLNPLNSNFFPYPPNLNYNWNRGHLLQKDYYDQDGFRTKTEKFKYTNYTRSAETGKARYIYALKMGRAPYTREEDGGTIANDIHNIFLKMSKYVIMTDIIKLPSSKEEIIYFKNGQSPVSTYESTYYSAGHLNAVKKHFRNSEGLITEKEFKYPINFEVDADWAPLMSSNWLIEKNVTNKNSLPIEMLEFKTRGNLRYLTNGSFFSFVLKRGDLVDEIMSFETDYPPVESTVTKSHFSGPNLILDSRFKKKNKYAYNAVGKPIRIEKNGVYTYFIYGYKDQYPVAKIEGLGDQGVPSTYYNQDILNSGDNVEEQLVLLRNQYKNNPEVQIETYTYKPLVGMTSKTDARGYIEYYIYDGFGRLKSILDQNKNVVKDYRYNHRP